ncbi:MAG: phage portal protein [Chloroflexi bacterium]|nr:phage portal protein [Chloroflexota bacterium]
MRQQLRIPEGRELGANHCELVISSMTDRLTVTGIEGATAAATAWLREIAEDNRLDGFQMNVHESALCDGDTYVAVVWDNENARISWVQELAYDGIEGVIGFPKGRSTSELAAAIKIWQETTEKFADTLRVNLYLPDRIYRYVRGANEGGLRVLDDDGGKPLPWVDKAGRPLGVPFVHFANRRRGRGGFGLSELRGVVPQQDQLNRTTHSIAMTTELLGFPIRWVKGWQPDAGIAPGMFMVMAAPKKAENGAIPAVTEQQAKHIAAIQVGTFDQADVSPLLDAYRNTKTELAETTRTPSSLSVSDDASGESRKEAEKGLLGKIARFHVTIGNCWEDVARLTTRVYDAFSPRSAPKSNRWTTQWRAAELRSNSDVLAEALILEKLAGLKEALVYAARVTGWDAQKIEELVAERQASDEASLNQMMQLAPGFSGRPAAVPQLSAPQQSTGTPDAQNGANGGGES